MADHYQATYTWIRQHVTLVIFLVLSVPFVLVIAIVYFTGYQYIKDSITQRANSKLSDFAAEIRYNLDAGITDLCRGLSFFAISDRLEDLQDDNKLQWIFSRLEMKTGNVIKDLALVDHDGNVVAGSLLSDCKYADLSSKQWYVMSCEHQVYVSDIYIDSRKNPYFIISVHLDHPEDRAILMVSVDGGWLSSFVETVRLGKSGEAFIVNSNGIIQSRSSLDRDFGQIFDIPLQDLHAHKITTTTFYDQGREALAAVATLKSNHNWLVVVGQDMEEAVQDISMVKTGFGMIVFLGVIFIIIIGSLTSSVLMRKIRQADAKKCEIDEQLIQSQKLAAIGQLSSGVAHEINNPLAVIGEEAGWLQDLLKKEDAKSFKYGDDFRDSLNAIVDQVRRCKEVTHKLLSFARKMDSNFSDVNLKEAVDEVVSMREQDAFLDNITINKIYEKNLPIIFSEPYLLRQLLLNLLNNALDAVRKDGKVTIHTRLEDQNKIIIDVIDNGVGIPDENLGKIFDPFFTTKPPGKGTGLGLSTCHGIVNKLGGDIRVKSRVNEGSTFSVILPVKSLRDHPADE
ncbi:sensor histidine kinase [Desulfonatronovibrio magnus]|uniref:sensor histidine kinase n=1 Tax=Desulfonatronovibrio magnus TaxID=698827 RepID=UPI0005EAF8A7|nr:PAS domain-containing sensor histidine kinase [Desulfonatronovibrio magnus]